MALVIERIKRTFSTADSGDFKDQITWSPDGNFLFISNRTAPFKLEIVDRSGAIVQNVLTTSEPDGIAFHAATPHFVVINNTDGTMTRFDFAGDDYSLPPTQTAFATGGFRGDMTVVGSDSCLYLTQNGTRYANGIVTGEDSVVQICGGFAPTAGDAPIAAQGTTFSATEGQSFSGKVATVTDGDSADMANEYAATIDWGDGTTSTGTVTGPVGGPYDVNGTHTYQEEGTDTVMVHVTDSDSSNTADATSTANVGDAALTSSCAMPSSVPQTYSGPTATFSDLSSTGTPSDFSATINWGDGSSTGVISGGPGTLPYTVSGTHTFSSTGFFTVTTTVTDVGTSTTTATCTNVLVFAGSAPGGGSFAISDLESATGTNVMFWGAQWWKHNPTANGSHASFKGFAESPAAATCGVTWSTDPGNSSPPPSGPLPAFMAVIVTGTYGQSGSTISGDTVHVVIVQTNPGYQPDPGHPGTGTVVAQVC